MLKRNPLGCDLLLLAGLCFLCFFWRLGSVGLFDFNEGLYVSTAREMYVSGDWITPRSNGMTFFDKPPLALWCDVISFHLFGVNEFAARFPVALAATLLVFLTYGFGVRYFGRRAGLLAAFLLPLNPMFFGTARQMTMDIHQSLWFAVAMVCFFLGYTATTLRGKRWYYGFWAGCGLSFMAKSAPGLFPVFIAIVFVILQERFRLRSILQRVWEAKLLLGIPLLLAIILPWHILAYQANGYPFWQEYFLHHHVQLLNGKDFGHVQPIWYYLPALLAGFFPWSVFLPWAICGKPDTEEAVSDQRSAISQRAQQAAPLHTPHASRLAHRFVQTWAVVVFLVFTVMSSKLVSYLLPMYPAAALLVGHWMARTVEAQRERGLKIGTAAVALLMAAATLAAILLLRRIADSPQAEAAHRVVPPPVVDWALRGMSLVTIGAALAAILIWRQKRAPGVLTLVGTVVAFFVLCIQDGLMAMEATVNAPLHALARETGARLSATTPFALHIAGPVRPSVLFYLPCFARHCKPTPLNEGRIWLDTGEKPPIDAFLARARPAYVLTDTKRADALRATNPCVVVEQRHDRWVLLRAERIDGRK